MIEIERPRSATELFDATFGIYRRVPWLFLALAAVVVVPYGAIELIPNLVLHGLASFLVGFPLTLANLALVLPLITAFHVFAVDELRDGRRPTFASACRRGIATLPVVSAATIMSWLGIAIGFVALVVPGVILWLRWIVVAQVAAIEDHDWQEAFERSRTLTDGRYGHAFGFLLLVVVITSIPGLAISFIFGFHPTLVSSLVRLPFNVLTSSFAALASALLYFDLRSRQPPIGDTSQVIPDGHPLDPRSYEDEDRPSGWYVDPSGPTHMRYWPGDGPDGWSRRRAKTPRASLADWRAGATAGSGSATGPPTVEPTGHPLDPDSYSDEERPPGWYVIPDTPWKMRYWLGGDEGWSGRTAKTPKQTQAGWYKVNQR